MPETILTDVEALDRSRRCRICKVVFVVPVEHVVEEHALNVEAFGEQATIHNTIEGIDCCPRCDGR